MTDLSKVRTADPRDEAEILRLCEMLHEENGLFPMDINKVRMWVRSILDPEMRAPGMPLGIIGVIGPHNDIEGMIFMIVSGFWYAKDDAQHLEEFFNFVRPDCRRSTHAKSLITFAKTCSDRMGIPLNIGVISNERTEAKVRLYARQLTKVGEFFMHMPGGA